MIDTKQITQQLEKSNLNRQFDHDSGQIDLAIPDNITEIEEVQTKSSIQAQVEIPRKG